MQVRYGRDSHQKVQESRLRRFGRRGQRQCKKRSKWKWKQEPVEYFTPCIRHLADNQATLKPERHNYTAKCAVRIADSPNWYLHKCSRRGYPSWNRHSEDTFRRCQSDFPASKWYQQQSKSSRAWGAWRIQRMTAFFPSFADMTYKTKIYENIRPNTIPYSFEPFTYLKILYTITGMFTTRAEI